MNKINDVPHVDDKQEPFHFPLNKMAVFQNGRSKIADGLENAELACKNVLSLPIEPLQREEVTAQVIEAVKNP